MANQDSHFNDKFNTIKLDNANYQQNFDITENIKETNDYFQEIPEDLEVEISNQIDQNLQVKKSENVIIESSNQFDKNIIFQVPFQNQQQENMDQNDSFERDDLDNSLELDDQEENKQEDDNYYSMQPNFNTSNFKKVQINNKQYDIVVDNLEDSLMVKNGNMMLQSFKQPKEDNIQYDKIDVQLQSELNQGAQASIYLCTINKDQKNQWISKTKKIMNNQNLSEQVQQQMYKEYQLGKDLKHENIVDYKYFTKIQKPNKVDEYHIIIEFMEGGNLSEIIQEQGKISSMKTIQKWTKQILEGLNYLHQNQIIHQDLKPQNILFSKDRQNIKLCDLGISSQIENTISSKNAESGTIRYMAPEQLDGLLTYKIDIWAFGCVLLEMLTGEKPYFNIKNDFAVSNLLFKGQNPILCLEEKHEKYIQEINDEYLVDLLLQCFIYDYKQRPTVQSLLDHPFYIIF